MEMSYNRTDYKSALAGEFISTHNKSKHSYFEIRIKIKNGDTNKTFVFKCKDDRINEIIDITNPSKLKTSYIL